MNHNKHDALTVIAKTDSQFKDFSPYVSAIQPPQWVIFQARLQDGSSGLFSGDGNIIHKLIRSNDLDGYHFYSHPDINASHHICVYANDPKGQQCLLLITPQDTHILADTHSLIQSIGPLGPTINNHHAVAFRGTLNSGHEALFIGQDSQLTIAANTQHNFNDFQGIPVINESGSVLFRANTQEAVQVICLYHNQRLYSLVNTRHTFQNLGLFPDHNDLGTLIFNAEYKTGSQGIFTFSKGLLSTVIDSHQSDFESFRGALINNHNEIIFYATPRGKTLGIYSGQAHHFDKILAIGDPLLDSYVKAFALNSVSFNDHAQIALRLELENGEQAILRIETSRLNPPMKE